MSIDTPYIIKKNTSLNLDKSFEVESSSTTNGIEIPIIFTKQWDDAWSYSAWFKVLNSSRSLNFFANNSSGTLNNDGLSILLFGGAIFYSWDSDSAQCGGIIGHSTLSSLTLDTWYHLVCTYPGSRLSTDPNFKLYINGVEGATYTGPIGPPATGTIPYNATNSYIASDGAPNIPAGDEARVVLSSFWGVALSQSDVDELYNSGLTIKNPLNHSKSGFLEHSYSFISDTISAGNTVTDDTGNQNGVFETGVGVANDSSDFPP